MKYSNFLWKLLCTALIAICLICYQYTAVSGQKKTAIRESEIESVENWNSQVRAMESQAAEAETETESEQTSGSGQSSESVSESEEETEPADPSEGEKES